MPDIWYDVDAALAEVPVNLLPLVASADGLTIDDDVNYNVAGLDLVWHFVTTAGAYSQTAVTPTDTGGAHDWIEQGNGLFTIEIPASGGTINNDTEGFGWFTGVATGILPWRGPVIGFRAAGLNNLLIDDAFSTTRGLAGTALPAAAADAAGGLVISDAGGLDVDAKLANTHEVTAARMGALTDWINGGRLDLILDDILADTGTTLDGKINTIDDFLDTEVAAIKTKTDYLPSATAGAAGGLFIAGSNAATSITTALTANITGNLSGSVGSVTGAVGSVTGAVGSVTGAVGSVTGAVGSVGAGGITAASLAADVQARLGIVAYGTAQSADGTHIQLASASTFADDELNGAVVVITGGSAGVGQARLITDYVSSTDTATVDTWTTTPTGTITYVVFAAAPASATSIPAVNVTQWLGTAAATPTTAGVPEVDVTHWKGSAAADMTGDAYARLGAAGAGLTAVPWNAAWDAEVQSEATDALNAYDPPTNAEMEARTLVAADYVVVGDTLAAVTTVTNLTNAPTNGDLTATMKSSVTTAASSSTPTVTLADDAITAAKIHADAGTEIANAVVGKVVEAEGSITLQQAIQAILAACAGVTADADSSPILFKTPNGARTTISSTVDGTNRTAITLTFS